MSISLVTWGVSSRETKESRPGVLKNVDLNDGGSLSVSKLWRLWWKVLTLTYFFFSEFIGKAKQTCPPEVTQTTGQLGIYCYGSSNLRHLLRGINFRRICNTNKSELVSVKIKSSGDINLRESSLSNLIREIKTDIQAFGQTSIEKRLYIIIHIGYNLFCDKEIGVDYIKHYNNFLQRLAVIFPPGNIIVYLPFVRGVCQKQVTYLHSLY